MTDTKADLLERLSDESDLCRAETATDVADLLDEAAERIKELEVALRKIADTNVVYPPHDPGNYMPPKGRDGPYRKIALAALGASQSNPNNDRC